MVFGDDFAIWFELVLILVVCVLNGKVVDNIGLDDIELDEKTIDKIRWYRNLGLLMIWLDDMELDDV